MEPHLGARDIRQISEEDKRKERRRAHLYTSGSHAELKGKIIAQSSVWLRVAFEDGFEDFELGAGCALAVFDLVGCVWIEGPIVNRGRVESRGHESGIGEVGRCGVGMVVGMMKRKRVGLDAGKHLRVGLSMVCGSMSNGGWMGHE